MAKLLKVNVTYHAPEGDSKVVEMFNTTFFDGQAIDLVGTPEHFETLQNNPHFQVNSHADYDPGDKGSPTTVPGPLVPKSAPAAKPKPAAEK